MKNIILLISLICTSNIQDPVKVQIISPCEVTVSNSLESEAFSYLHFYDSIIQVARNKEKYDSLEDLNSPMIPLIENVSLSNNLTLELLGTLEFQLSNFKSEYELNAVVCESRYEPTGQESLDFEILIDSVQYYADSVGFYAFVHNYKVDSTLFDDHIILYRNDVSFPKSQISKIHSFNLLIAYRIVYGIL